MAYPVHVGSLLHEIQDNAAAPSDASNPQGRDTVLLTGRHQDTVLTSLLCVFVQVWAPQNKKQNVPADVGLTMGWSMAAPAAARATTTLKWPCWAATNNGVDWSLW